MKLILHSAICGVCFIVLDSSRVARDCSVMFSSFFSFLKVLNTHLFFLFLASVIVQIEEFGDELKILDANMVFRHIFFKDVL